MIRFKGDGDDTVLVEVDGITRTHARDWTGVHRGSWDLTYMTIEQQHTLRVTACYDGVWRFAYGPHLETVKVPDWNCTLTVDGHTSVLSIDAPAGTIVESNEADDAFGSRPLARFITLRFDDEQDRWDIDLGDVSQAEAFGVLRLAATELQDYGPEIRVIRNGKQLPVFAFAYDEDDEDDDLEEEED